MQGSGSVGKEMSWCDLYYGPMFCIYTRLQKKELNCVDSMQFLTALNFTERKVIII
jgi:hypothetical protein